MNLILNSRNLIYISMIFISVLVMSVGYASYNSTLTISGEAVAMAPGDIFVSNIELVEMVDGTELYSPSVTDTTTNVGVTINSSSTTFTYKVTVTNTTDDYYYLSRIDELNNSNDGQYFILDMYIYSEFSPNSDTEFYIVYEPTALPADNQFKLTLEFIFGFGEKYKDETLAGADPVLIDGIIPIVYNETDEVWVKADVLNNEWYDYDIAKWANGASVVSSKRAEYVASPPGTVVPMSDITLMMVWIPRFSYTLKETYGYHGYGGSALSISTPGAFDIKFGNATMLDNGSGTYGTSETVPSGYYTSPAFCWGNTCDTSRSDPENTELNGFWVAKFEASKAGNLLYSKPNQKPFASSTISSSFYFVQDLMNGMDGYNNYGFVGEVDAHLMKNTEWGAIAYLSQSAFGKYGNESYTGANKEIYLNNCSTYVTGIGGSSAGDGKTTATCTSSDHTYETYNGMGASTTGNIYGIYDMIGGTFDRVMGIILTPSGAFDPDSSGFTTLPEGRYINIYPFGTYTIGDETTIKGDALTETINFYDDRYLNDPRFSSTNYYDYHWFYRGGSLFFANTDANGIFSYTLFSGTADPHHASRFTIAIYGYNV